MHWEVRRRILAETGGARCRRCTGCGQIRAGPGLSRCALHVACCIPQTQQPTDGRGCLAARVDAFRMMLVAAPDGEFWSVGDNLPSGIGPPGSTSASQLLDGLGAAAFHALIHLGIGMRLAHTTSWSASTSLSSGDSDSADVEIGHQMIVEGLAYLSHSWLPIGGDQTLFESERYGFGLSAPGMLCTAYLVVWKIQQLTQECAPSSGHKETERRRGIGARAPRRPARAALASPTEPGSLLSRPLDILSHVGTDTVVSAREACGICRQDTFKSVCMSLRCAQLRCTSTAISARPLRECDLPTGCIVGESRQQDSARGNFRRRPAGTASLRPWGRLSLAICVRGAGGKLGSRADGGGAGGGARDFLSSDRAAGLGLLLTTRCHRRLLSAPDMHTAAAFLCTAAWAPYGLWAARCIRGARLPRAAAVGQLHRPGRGPCNKGWNKGW